MLWLTKDQLFELTGYRQKSRQVQWLRENGVEHFVRASGHPMVPVTARREQDKPKAGPRFEALRA